MKCFRIFFKHTWHPQQMMTMSSSKTGWDYPYFDPTEIMTSVYQPASIPEEEFLPRKKQIPDTHINNNNSSIFEEMKTNVRSTNVMELNEVDVIAPKKNVATLTVVQAGSIPCQNSGCRNWGTRGVPESPWHILKTIFLVSIIVTLIIWVVIYALLAQYHIF
ncbi:uncharacterized protein LOC118446161 isoform X1 [Vespa mandarinia]|uniref:uncharacterized protein LOC118446161 isoform X1 n=2 Tax=Vespa mandarinia TaxID=7446 RepID=UPI0016189A6E|nr:uncharacterized protein LOC118446161 isoform X1 [Vespa mandarinia]